MKRIIITVTCLLIVAGAFSQNNTGLIAVKLKNTSLLPKKLTLVSYQPGETGNGTNGFVLLPGSEKRLLFKEGTKLYLASSQQVDTVMSGKRIDNGKPFLVVKKEDNEKIVAL